MKPLGMRKLIERDTDRDFIYIHGPEWMGPRLGDLLLMDYDGQKCLFGLLKLNSLYCTVKQLEF